MHPARLIMEINIVQNGISDNFYFDNKAVQSNLTELKISDDVIKKKYTENPL